MSNSPTPISDRGRNIRRVVLFTVLVLTFAFSAPLLGGDPGSPGPGFLLWMVSPLVVAMLLRVVTRDRSDLGIRFGWRRNARWYLLSLLLIPAVMGLTLLAGVAMSITTLTGFSLGAYLRTVLMAGGVFAVAAIFEEFGWRGYLAPKVAALGINAYAGHALVGAVWATWHLPFLAGFGWMYGSESIATVIPRFFLVSIALSVVYGEVRAITGTFWPAVVMHASGNAVGHALAADYVRISPGAEQLGSISTGFLPIICFGLVGILLHRHRHNARIAATAAPARGR